MRYSQMFIPTVREIPADAETVSHQLMIRAGLIRKLASGIYTYLPLGLRVIKKVEQIIREEMNRAGAQELVMPVVQPAELWKESGRWEHYGKELLRFRDRKDSEYCLAPTHEEVITDLVRNEVKSYRQLPLNLYQIQTKFRDEMRPRFGVIRCREFVMKDAYSFDIDEEGAELSYRKMFDAYQRIFTRCGLRFRAVEADTGSIGGSFSHEFLVMAETGEDEMVYCDRCGYAANMEKAETIRPEEAKESKELKPLEEVFTPNVKTIEEVCQFLQVSPQDVVKTLVYMADGRPVAVLIRGDEEVNEIKVKNLLGCDTLEMATDEEIIKYAGSHRGFVGPIGLKCRMMADFSLWGRTNLVVGANREDYHIKNANYPRDFDLKEFHDLRFIHEGDPCPRCGAQINFARGIEVGHVFKLGTKYSRAMRAVYLDRNGQEKYMIMGCYGIGVGRVVAACIEQHHDDGGIIWPISLAPFHVIITPVNVRERALNEAAEKIYQSCIDLGLEALLDDRDERAGVKFNDADLIGIPFRITVGPKKVAEGKVEIKHRLDGRVDVVPIEAAASYCQKAVFAV
ncbi:MAG: proline--tRNA ligase [Syntrophales bacterium]|nr:proline--tRNA ligase [Syntrophales bacterium]